jgi:hypothetical protein
MGMIYHYYSPSEWIECSTKKLKEAHGGGDIVEIEYGYVEDYPNIYTLTMWFRKSILDMIQNEQCFIEYNAGDITLKDKKTNKVISKLASSLY